MAQYALDDGMFIHARDGSLQTPYTCAECGGAMRLRLGGGKKAHFYHLRTTPACRLYYRMERHTRLQLELATLIPELLIEHPFPNLCRVADLFWPRYRIAFEIQCSLLSTAQAEARELDYRREGIRVVWLLDDRLYFRRALKPGEHSMRRSGAYYFTFPLNQPALIYDAWEISFDRGKRWKGPIFPIRIDLPRPSPRWLRQDPIPKLIRERTGIAFKGDLQDRAEGWLKTPSGRDQLKRWCSLEAAHRNRFLKQLPQHMAWSGYEAFVRWILS